MWHCRLCMCLLRREVVYKVVTMQQIRLQEKHRRGQVKKRRLGCVQNGPLQLSGPPQEREVLYRKCILLLCTENFVRQSINVCNAHRRAKMTRVLELSFQRRMDRPASIPACRVKTSLIPRRTREDRAKRRASTKKSPPRSDGSART